MEDKKRLIDRPDLSSELIAKAFGLELDDGSDGEPDEISEMDVEELLAVLVNAGLDEVKNGAKLVDVDEAFKDLDKRYGK
jgi:hypothetical protein